MITPKTSFFARKNLLIISSVVVIFYVSVLTGAFISNKVTHDRKVNHSKAEQAKRAAVSKEEKSIQLGQAYLTHTIGAVDSPQRLVLDYLKRKYDLDEKLGINGSPFNISEDPSTYPEEVNFVARIAYPDRLVMAPPRNKVTGAELTNIYSANCDHTPLPSNFWTTMEQNYKAGSYYLTHVALAFAFMKDNACAVPADKIDLQDKVNEGMVKIAASPETAADLRYEAIAFLMISGKRGLVEPAWIDAIVTEQDTSGGWSEKLGDKKMNDHASVLALWALLEYSRPDTPYEPLIRRPTE